MEMRLTPTSGSALSGSHWTDASVSSFISGTYPTAGVFYGSAQKYAAKLRFGNLTEYNFDLFLDAVESCRSSDSNVHPRGLHFQTHTAKMWDDIVDDEQTVLLNWMFRLEDLNAGVDQVREELRLPALSTEDRARKNAASKMEFTPNAQQRARVKALFAEEFDLYEGYCRSV